LFLGLFNLFLRVDGFLGLFGIFFGLFLLVQCVGLFGKLLKVFFKDGRKVGLCACLVLAIGGKYGNPLGRVLGDLHV
jgi:hypothetical protein